MLNDLSVIKNRRFGNWFWYIHLRPRNEQRELLKLAFKDDEYVRVLLHYCYSPTISYHFPLIKIAKKDKINSKGETTSCRYQGKGMTTTYKEFCSILDSYLESKITRKESIEQFYYLFKGCNRYTLWAYNRVLQRELKIGADLSTVKKLFPELFSAFPKIKKPIKIKDTEKLQYDYPLYVNYTPPGTINNRILLVSEDKSFKIITHNGRKKHINLSFDVELPRRVVLDGYFVWEKIPRKTILRKRKDRKKYKSITLYNMIPVFYCFDYIPLSDFKKGICDIPLRERLMLLRSLNIWNKSIKIDDAVVLNDSSNIAELKVGSYLVRGVNSIWGKDTPHKILIDK